MSVKGPIIVIEDDIDDKEFYISILQEQKIENEVLFFADAELAYKFLEETLRQPFLILSDINLPGISGIELKRKIHDNTYLRNKSIPFVFLTTSNNESTIQAAYSMMVQGYFVKPNSVTELAETFKQIIGYWKICKHPNSQ